MSVPSSRSMDRLRNAVLRRCKSLSSRVGARRPSSAPPYSNLRSMSTRDAATAVVDDDDDDGAVGGVVDKEAASDVAGTVGGGGGAVVFVGSSRRRYVISAEYLSHPLIAALIVDQGEGRDSNKEPHHVAAVVNCEVVLFDHLLWMLDNGAVDDDLSDDDGGATMRELAQLYAC